MRRCHRGLSIAVVLLGAWAAGFLGAGAASAHVSVSSPAAVQGGYASVTFKVPTESATVSTTGLKVQLPPDQPLASVSVLPVYGWTHTITKAKLATPISSGDATITEAASVIEWKADSARTAIKPGEFNQFTISVGPLPKAPSMTFKALQTYSDGEVVSWIEEAAEGSAAEPEHPAPTLKLAAAGGTAVGSTAVGSTAPAGSTASASISATGVAVSSTSDGGSDARANTALILGALGFLLGGIALAVVLFGRRPHRAG
ncbi:MAG: YcnI family protein [Jatrophihabitantaceae bacterium]